MHLVLSLLASAVLGPHSILIRGGTVVDGLGGPPRKADIRVVGDRIEAIGRLKQHGNETVIDAKGLVVAPGFIDAHSHADGNASEQPLQKSQILQGITTAIVGQDGGGKTPITDLFASLAKARTTLNYAAFAGHGALREKVMGKDYKRPASPEELDQMKGLLEQDLKAGALGLSSGIEYDPGYYANTEELIELAKVAARYRGGYISHVRDEGNAALDSFREVIRIAREAGLPAQISHIKLGTAPVWGKAPEVLKLIHQARMEGLSIAADVYPYLYWQSTITVLTLDRNWDDKQVWVKALAEVGGPQNVLLSEYSPNPAWVGKTIKQIADETGKDAVEVIQEIVRKTHGPEGQGRESIVCTAMSEPDLVEFLKSPHIMFCSDGRDGGSHPRGAGSFPRILGRYVREKKVLSLQEAIRKMTSLPASRFRLIGRGRIAKGAFADITIFDPKTITDLATPNNPTALSKGVLYVLVNGQVVLEKGRMTGKRPGRHLKRPGGVTPALPAGSRS